MPDIINLLPENIANQIAAGEVIQRPASAVKEFLENAIDAEATEIQLIVVDSGKSLIQVIDNGKGMSETDARMSFERHATSKIQNIDDLFHIHTMGFRGEALPSIAGVAKVELKTAREGEEMGTYIEIENSTVTKQEPIAGMKGTSIAMKNLFFNVPARRNFLKSNNTELRHIIDEFTRIALSFPEIVFTLTSNGQEVYHLQKGSLKQRIIQLLGKHYQSKLVSVREETDYMNVYGFVGKPETAKKTRGDQFFFVNNRFIKSAYLNHAVVSAYSEMIDKSSYPMYALFIDVDPASVDINVHPTKQEIKFEDERVIYAFVNAAVKHALAQFSITPSLDFDLDRDMQHQEAISNPFTPQARAEAEGGNLYKAFSKGNQAHFIDSRSNLSSFADFFKKERPEIEAGFSFKPQVSTEGIPEISQEEVRFSGIYVQLLNAYLVGGADENLLIIDQQHAHERVLYERIKNALADQPFAIQRSLFPEVIEVNTADAIILNEIMPDLSLLGFRIEPFGNDSFVIQGTPADILRGNEKRALEMLLEDFKNFRSEIDFSPREKLVRAMAYRQSIKRGQKLEDREIAELISNLSVCEVTNVTPSGKPIFLEFRENDLKKMFDR